MDRTASNPLRARRHAALLSGCALGLVLAAIPQAAVAQDTTRGFQGSVGAGGVGSVNVTTGTQSTTIDVGSAQAVVNWTPTDTSTSGTIDFLPEDYSASFISSNLSEYTVLNRILPGGTAQIGLNGHITSSSSNGDGGQNVGGNVWFYTPNGFVVGPRATIQVGGLVMTTNDIVFGSANTGGDDLTDVNGNILFRGTTPTSSIVINPGAQIIGSNSSSYIAMVSPRIEQGGYVSADRSIAYVAGNQVDLKINAGNFDIVVGEGTEDANGIVHTGTTTGYGSSDFTDVKRMQFVAVPKNTALTMLLSGSIGYIPAVSSFSDGGSIVLTAGDEGSPDGNINIGATRFGSALTAHATGDITVAPPSSESVEGINEATFESYATLYGDKSVHLTAVGGSAINAYRGLSIYSSNAAGGGAIDIVAGPASLIPPDPEFPGAPDQFTGAGFINVYGGLSASANHYGGTSEDGTTGLDARGGTINLFADGGSIYSDYTYLYAGAQGGFGTKTGGDGYGGTINVRAGLGGFLNSSYLSADARGDGGGSYEFTETGSTGGFGGVGHGGAITIADSSGPADEDPTGGFLGVFQFFLDASSVGGNSLQRASGMGGDAFGGTIDIKIDRQSQDDIGYISGYATAADGDGGSVDPIGGDITMTVGGGVGLSLTSLYFDAGAQASVNSPVGAVGKGGTIDLMIKDAASLNVTGDTTLNATADVSPFFSDTIAQSSPDLTGGTIKLTADSGSFTTNNLNIDVSANNVGATTSAGFAHGGTAIVTAANGGSIATFLVTDPECTVCAPGGDFNVEAEGYGTSGLSANSVTGGDITLSAQSGGTIFSASGEIDLYAGTSYGSAETSEGIGVTGQGGTIAIDAIGGTILTGIYADVSGQGGDADNGGGSGTGGTIAVRVLESGALVNPLFASATGYGGHSYITGDGGDGTGGRLTFLTDESASFGNFGLEFYGDGQGGSATVGTGGDGIGGSAQIDILGGKQDWSEIYLNGEGRGASSQGDGSLAGSAYGSVDGLNLHIGGGADMHVSFVGIDASAAAGADGDGNEAIGGSASLLVDQLASLSSDEIGINATGALTFEERDPATFNSTPDAKGGTASAVADSGTITTPFLEVVANGETGGGLLSAGSATGGSATVGSANGGLIDVVAAVEAIGGLTLEAQGRGAEGPFAAHATGGAATLYTAGGAITSVYDISVNADATTGAFANAFVFDGAANGFNATGGTASVEMRTGGSGGGSIDTPSLTVTAQGLANGVEAVEGTGGIGQGGAARLDAAQGTLTTDSVLLLTDGFGGQASENTSGGAAFVSGDGIGGTALFSLSGGTVITDDVELSADGNGAGGVGFTAGATPSVAASGRGGTASFVASGGTLNDFGSVLLHAYGFGGNGDFNPNGGVGPDGGAAFGGTTSFTAPAGSTASLNISGPIRLVADGVGGAAGFSTSEIRGSGGDATGGTATVSLADIPFTFGVLALNANGFAGDGDGGTGTGGLASFGIADSVSVAIGPRVLDRLTLHADSSGTGGTVAGATAFSALAGSADSGLTITNTLIASADGATGPAGYGFTGAISGAPVTVGGAVLIDTPRDAILSITGPGALNATGDLSINAGRTFTSTGAISTAANASIIAPGGISMTDLAVGGTTLLQAVGGPVSVSHHLSSVGPVTVLGQSVSIFSLGALDFADADATAGDLEIETAGNLTLATVDATGAVTLTSNGGSIHNTGAVNGVGITYVAAGNVVSDTTVASGGALTVDAGGTFTAPGTVSAVGNVSLSAYLGLNLTGVISGETTDLRADAGALTIGNLTSPGAVTASAQSVSITSPGALTFTNAQATAGNLAIATGGNLALADAGASGSLSLTSGGSVVGTGSVTAGANATVISASGVSLATLASGGATLLDGTNGNLTVTNLNSAGAVTARARAVTIGSSGSLTFADLDATAGDAIVRTGGNLTVNTVDATGLASLTSAGGALNVNGAISANDIALSSLASLALSNSLSAPGGISLTSTSGSVSATSPITAGGSLTVSGNSGITLGTASSGGTTNITAANGAISVTDLTSADDVTALARAITIGSAGALRFANAQATSGDVTVTTAGDLFLSQGSASGRVNLTSTGGIAAGTGTISSGGDAAIDGRAGIALGTLSSGGTTKLTSANGAIGVSDLLSAGAVTATGRSINIASSGALSFADAQAATGDLSVSTVGDLSVAQAIAAGTLSLTSTAGWITGTGTIGSGGNAIISGNTGIGLAALTSGGTTALTANTGTVNIDNLGSSGAVTASGRSVTIGSTGALTFADLDATGGNIAVQTAGNLAVATADATGSIALTSTGGAISGAGPIVAGGNLAVSGNAGVSLGIATSDGTTSLASANGAVGLTDLNSTGAVTASGRSVSIGSSGALTFADLDATAGNVAVQTAGSLTVATVDATGSIALTSTGGAVSGSGPVVAGGNLAVSGNTGIALGIATSGGTTSLASANGAVGVTNLNSVGAVAASGGSVTIGSSGALSFADLDATGGNVAVQTAGDLAFATVDAAGSVSLVSTGGALAGSGAIHGDAITLGSLADLQVDGLDTAGAISLTSTGGAVSAGAPITAGGNLTVSGLTAVSLGTARSGGTTALTSANGAVSVTNLASAGPVTASGRSVSIGSTGGLTFADLDATAGDIAVQTAGNLVLGAVDATGALTLTSTSGAVTASAPLSAGGNVAASGQTGVSLATVASGGTTTLTAANGAVAVTALTSTGALTASGRSIAVRSPGALTVANAQATAGNLDLQAAQALTVANASATGAASLTAGGDLRTTGTVSGASLSLTGTNVTVGGQATATQDLAVGANQLFTLNGIAAGKTVTVYTGDISIASTGRLGTRALTQSIVLRNLNTTSPMNIGGTGIAGEFSLDKTEATRLFADEQISFVSRDGEGAAGDARVGDFALAFGDQGNVGAGGMIKVDAGGVVTVNGAVALTTVSDQDTFAIDPTRIDVIAGSGSIVMKNANGALTGTIELAADRIAVADQTTLDTIAALSDFAAISAALDNPAAAPDGGYLQAGTINLFAGDGLFIQNGGATTAYDDRRGFLANALNIETGSTSPRIAINGVIVTPTRQLVGLDTAQGVSINGVIATDIATGASITINGCAAGVNCGIPEYTFGGLSNDDLDFVTPPDDDLLSVDEGTNRPSAQQGVRLEDNRPLITPPLVDEPITGVGNDDLWQVKCDPEGDKSGCPTEEGTE